MSHILFGYVGILMWWGADEEGIKGKSQGVINYTHMDKTVPEVVTQLKYCVKG